jgi:SDR family mycofactocin-dependent oxidoreductase
MSLAGKIAFVTGGARGQGRSHALALAEAGADVAVCDIGADLASVKYPLGTSAEIDETVRLIEKHGRGGLGFVADVRDRTALQKAVDETVAEFGKVDILCANAGIFSRGTVTELSDDSWHTMLDVNLTGVFNAMRAVIPGMVERGFGRIIATSSVAGKVGAPNMSHYAAAKWGVIGLVKSAAAELATTGVTVNAICPTNVNTTMLHNDDMYQLFVPGAVSPTSEQATTVFATTVPMGVPWVEPEDVSATVLFLAGDGGKYLTGETIAVAAGQTMFNAG